MSTSAGLNVNMSNILQKLGVAQEVRSTDVNALPLHFIFVFCAWCMCVNSSTCLLCYVLSALSFQSIPSNPDTAHTLAAALGLTPNSSELFNSAL